MQSSRSLYDPYPSNLHNVVARQSVYRPIAIYPQSYNQYLGIFPNSHIRKPIDPSGSAPLRFKQSYSENDTENKTLLVNAPTLPLIPSSYPYMTPFSPYVGQNLQPLPLFIPNVISNYRNSDNQKHFITIDTERLTPKSDEESLDKSINGISNDDVQNTDKSMTPRAEDKHGNEEFVSIYYYKDK